MNSEGDEFSAIPSLEFISILPERNSFLTLFETTGWNSLYGASAEELNHALRSSWFTLSGVKKNELIGFGRIISDGVMYALICDMIVLPAYRGKGVGSHILKLLVQKCQEANMREIWLFSAKDKNTFYEKRGFVPRSDEGPGMYYRAP